MSETSDMSDITMPYHYHTLPNGLRIVACHQPGAMAEYCGLQVAAGTRQEACPDQWGLAHFVEHTIFKGTSHRRAWHILNRMEAVGGELNAFTTKEETVIYSAFPPGCLSRAAGLICDLATDSLFPEAELARERDVVLDELDSYLDMPSDAVYDDFEDLIYKDTSLGHNILGTRQSVSGLDSAQCRRWLAEHYTASTMTFFYAGREDPQRVFRLVERLLGHLPASDAPARPADAAGERPVFDEVKNIGSHQAHTLLGAVIPGIHDDNLYPVALLTNILGGPGMNSLLNVSLRERRGLVYNVEASTTFFHDTGLLTVYFGCDPEDVNRCLRLTRGVIQSLIDTPLTQRRLEACKRQYIGQQRVGAAFPEQTALSMARSMMYHGRVATLEEVADNVSSVTPLQLQEAAGLLAPTRLSRLTYL